MKKLIFYLITFFCLTTSCGKDDSDYDVYSIPYYIPLLGSMNMPRPEGSYNYPIIPGTKEWKKFDSRDEKENACQVPFKVLQKQSTQAVIQALWEYPLKIDFLLWSNNQDGYNFVYQPLNAGQVENPVGRTISSKQFC